MRAPSLDVLVVGAGPPGIATALALHARGLRVVIAERRVRGTRGTPGETLPGRVRSALDALGIADVLDDWSCTPIRSHRARWGPALRERHLAHDPDGHAWQVDRDGFDELLRLRAVERGIDVRLGMRCTSVVPETGGWRIALDQERGRSSLRAAFVVDATGRSAFVARRLGARHERCDRTVAVIAGILGPAAARCGSTLVEVCPDGWWYAAALPSDDIAVNFVTDAALVPVGASARTGALFDQLCNAPLIERYLAGCGSPAWLRVVSAAPAVTSPVAGAGWLATGDASSVHDPLAFSGVTKALEQGLSSAAAIAAWFGGDPLALDRYRAAAEDDFAAHLQARRACYAAAGLSRFPFWRQRAASSAPSLARTSAPWWPMTITGPHRAVPDPAHDAPAAASAAHVPA